MTGPFKLAKNLLEERTGVLNSLKEEVKEFLEDVPDSQRDQPLGEEERGLQLEPLVLQFNL